MPVPDLVVDAGVMSGPTHSSSASPVPPAAPAHDIMLQAAEWFALLRSGDATAQDRTAWQAWLNDNQQHRDAWQYVDVISRRFEPVRTPDNAQAAVNTLQMVRGTSLKRRTALNGLAIMFGAGLLGWGAWRGTPLGPALLSWSADYRTATGEIREITLADGTRVWLNTASAMNADYQPALRRLQLLSGEVLISTAADATRPFVVDTGHGRMQALGTRFTVRQEGGETYLAVYQGAVRIHTRDSDAEQIIGSGQQVRFSASRIGEIAAAEPGREAWARGVLLAEDIPLADVVRELNRYQHGYLSLAPELATLRVVGGYPLQDPDKVLSMLAEVLPIQVRRILPWWISIESKPPAG